MSRRFQLLVWVLLGAMVALTAATAALAGALPQSASRPLEEATQRGALSADFGAQIAVDQVPSRRGSNLSVGGGSFGFGFALRGSAPVGNGPSLLAVNPATHTIYVANGNNDNGPDAGGDTVSVINARRCNAKDVSRCKGPWPTITVGNRTINDLPSGVAVDEKTDTVYVTNGGRLPPCRCSTARLATQPTPLVVARRPPTVPVGQGPTAPFDDSANHTVYISNFSTGGPQHHNRVNDRHHDLQRNRPGGLSDHAAAHRRRRRHAQLCGRGPGHPYRLRDDDRTAPAERVVRVRH